MTQLTLPALWKCADRVKVRFKVPKRDQKRHVKKRLFAPQKSIGSEKDNVLGCKE